MGLDQFKDLIEHTDTQRAKTDSNFLSNLGPKHARTSLNFDKSEEKKQGGNLAALVSPRNQQKDMIVEEENDMTEHTSSGTDSEMENSHEGSVSSDGGEYPELPIIVDHVQGSEEAQEADEQGMPARKKSNLQHYQENQII